MTLRTYILKRVVISIFVLWLVASLNFIIFTASKGDPVRYVLRGAGTTMTEEQRRLLTEAYGLNATLEVKYLKSIQNQFTFGIVPPYFGWDYETGTWVADGLWWRLTITIFLLGSALIGRIILGIPTGIFAASRRGSKVDVGVVTVALFTHGVPAFFIQLMAVFIFSYLLVKYNIFIFPITAPIDANVRVQLSGLDLWVQTAWHMTLPIITLVLVGFGAWALYIRNMLIDALTQDYVVTARAKGLSDRTVLYKHAFKSILPSVATMITLAIPGVVTGAIITESIFKIEGIGTWYIHALQESVANYPVAQAVLFVYAALVILCNLIADLLYGILDPRIRVGMRR
jgi:peptide/nickel transport system permease protein